MASQEVISRKRNASPLSTASSENDLSVRAGRILAMRLKNIMCHSNLEISFDSNIIFLTGNNGSGKSAILAALSLGLGSKARTTNRGSITNIKAFIKFGTNSGSIEIVLSNEGPHAYKPDLYGTSVTIQRVLSMSGTSSYKLKNHNGKMVSKSLRDLNEMLSELNIQVDNPICILSQDTARSFLNTNDPKLKYKLFYRATRLQDIEETFINSVNMEKATKELYSTKKKEEASLVKEVEKLEKKVKEAERAEAMKNALGDLKREMAWAEAAVAEERYSKKSATVENMEREIESLQREVNGKKESLEKLNEEKRALEEELKEINLKANTKETSGMSEIEGQINQINEEIYRVEMKISKCETEIKSKRADLQVDIDMMNSEKDIELREKQRTDELEILRKQEKESGNIIESYENEVLKLSSHIKHSESEIAMVEHEYTAVNHKIGRLNDRLSGLKQQTNPLGVYGQQIVSLVSAIKSEAQNFSVSPLGPLGSYVTITDQKWTIAVEAFFGNDILRSFMVNSWEDKKRLDSLMSRVFRGSNTKPPSVITTTFHSKLHDVSRYAVVPGNYSRLIDVLKVDNAVVMNCLIDQTHLENTLLFEDRVLALNLMAERRTVPQNCRVVYTTTADAVYPDPDYRIYGGRLKHPKFIQVDCSEAANECKRELATAHAQRNQINAKLSQMKESIKVRNADLSAARQKFNACKAKLPVIQSKIQKLEGSKEYFNYESLEKEAAEFKRDISILEKQLSELKDSLNKLESERESLGSKIKDLKKADRELMESRHKIREQIDAKNVSIRNFNNEKALREKSIKSKRQDLQESQKELETLTEEWSKVCEDTQSQVGHKPDKVRKAYTIREEVDRIENLINQMNIQELSQVHERLAYHLNMINRNRPLMESTKKNLKELEKTRRENKIKLQETKDYLKEYTIHNFKNFLKCRSYQGDMTIDHDTKQLEMVVIPHKGAKGITQVSNLSGGERTFSTVAFLYALWKTVDFPFYFLDEFDVFMDPQNRRLVIQILIEHGKKNTESQYVFLTPQDVSFIKDEKVAIRKLEDPQRRPNEA